MRINDTSNHHFQISIAGKKAEPEETGKHHKQSDMPIELRIQDILDISGKVPKLSGHSVNGKYFLDVPEELNRTLLSTNPDQVVITSDTLSPWQVDVNETTYEKYGDSNLLNVKNEALRNSYYRSLFVSDTDTVNSVFGLKYSLTGRNAYNVELTTARYEELREQIIGAYGNDKELLDRNLKSLDKAFESHLGDVAQTNANMVWIDQVMERAAKAKGEEPPYELSKLATNKNFNADEFSKNAKSLMQQFAQSYLQLIKDGTSYASAWDNAVKIMTLNTKTTSVNDLSFSDFMILDRLPWSNATTLAENNAALSNRNNSFINNPNLSEELRNILNIM